MFSCFYIAYVVDRRSERFALIRLRFRNRPGPVVQYCRGSVTRGGTETFSENVGRTDGQPAVDWENEYARNAARRFRSDFLSVRRSKNVTKRRRRNYIRNADFLHSSDGIVIAEFTARETATHYASSNVFPKLYEYRIAHPFVFTTRYPYYKSTVRTMDAN